MVILLDNRQTVDDHFTRAKDGEVNMAMGCQTKLTQCIMLQSRQYVGYYGLSCLFLMTFVCFFYYEAQERTWATSFYWAPRRKDYETNKYPSEDEKQTVKNVLFWNFPSWQRRNIFDGCDYKCVLTTNKSKMADQNAVIFHCQTMRLPPKPRGQVWVFYTVEPPTICANMHKWRRLFNWTINYRRDSDILSRYGSFVSKHLNSKNKNASHLGELSTRKKYSAVWFVGHCRTDGKRETFVNRLQKHMDVNIYGRCGKLACIENGPASTWSKKCLQKVEKDTRYYLSFENSLCRDYITEKAYKVFKTNSLVPVVRGGVNYSMYLPPDSFIDSSRFKDATTLSKYLVDIKNNKIVFSRLFENRNLYMTNFNDNWSQKPFCEMCRRLHSPEKYGRLYNDVSVWGRGKGKTSACRKPSDIK